MWWRVGAAGIAPAGTRPSMAQACGSPCDCGQIPVAISRLSLLLRGALLGIGAKGASSWRIQGARVVGASSGAPAGYAKEESKGASCKPS